MQKLQAICNKSQKARKTLRALIVVEGSRKIAVIEAIDFFRTHARHPGMFPAGGITA
jgi:hypothetical protein